MLPKLAIVVPCFNEEEVLPETLSRLGALLERLLLAGRIDAESRIFLVDDGSRDRTWALIETAVEQGLPVVGVKLSRNRGHQNALLAGLATADGDAIVSIDADLQDDVDAIERMLAEFERGAEIVYGVRSRRDTDTIFKRSTANGFYRLMRFMGAETVDNHADFRLMSRRAVEALMQFREVNLYLRGIIPMLGFKTAVVTYERSARFAGESKYPLKKMLALSFDAITSFSVFPLRVISGMGLVVSAATVALGLWILARASFGLQVIPGWASTVLPIYFLGGIQLIGIGVIGEYVGKIYLETKGRPRYFIEAVFRQTPSAAAQGTIDPSR
jgi:glycosyltransferase involved in cell wall biosynthesis